MDAQDIYQNPLCGRYASREMQHIFSPNHRYQTWRRLWVALAEAEQELGLEITDHQIQQLRDHIEDIDYDVVAAREKEIRHDVMAHVYAYGKVCPDAKGIIHLGATSCYVTDNADVLIYREALRLIERKLVRAMECLSKFALEQKSTPTLGYTHLQPAQLVTVGKRACLWLQDLLMDYEDLIYVLTTLKLLGSKGTTGTQASFMSLFNNDAEKVKQLDALIAKKMGLESCFPVSGQTYPRKLDSRILNVLSGIAQSANRFGGDMRILQSMGEMEEPFEKHQVGSSAMAYKRNPMRSERMCSLARYVIADAANPAYTASLQWMERTLDDSANRRISIPEAFLATDAILTLFISISDGLVVYDKVIHRRIMEQLPFIATENILMAATKAGGDRQALHEAIRDHSMQAAMQVKQHGKPNDLLDRLAQDPAFGLSKEELHAVLDPKLYIGRAPQQVEEFIRNDIQPILDLYPHNEVHTELNV